MKQSINKFAFAAITATALSLALAGTAFAGRSTAVQPTLLAGNTMDKAEEAVSDTWITSKVKSTFLADDNLSGMDIKVETNQGVVALSGVVASDAERDLAIAKAKEIKGVAAVSADGLKSAN
ncbi:hyperosmotically inducible protein [Pseudomonas sp. SJZ079]|uniref:BON domain-containing protein n=1 Tax=Pseudomonas sp. SJZ079 TaxID=2572887 RepID=UPI00119AC189|nr:BON domain-containing protein [Pseudomonas sp. SJZ079]TWC40263.1 hyperosmotically inducible protein [Pseudomonas sp. SJZ079]